MDYISIIINTILLFILSNFYIFKGLYNIKIPFIITLIFVIFVSIFPSLFTTKLYDKYLVKIRNGYRLLIMFLINVFLDITIYLFSIFIYKIDIKILLVNLLFLIIILSLIFWSGMIRIFIYS